MYLCYHFLRMENKLKRSRWNHLSELMDMENIEIPRERVIINRTIGKGAFGTVFGGECQLRDNDIWTAVAVKALGSSTIEAKLDFLSEADMMRKFDHPNIIRLLGLSTSQEPIYMIMEFILYGKYFLL